MSHTQKRFPAFLSLVLAALIGGGLALGAFHLMDGISNGPEGQTIEDKQGMQVQNAGNYEVPAGMDFVSAAEKVTPTVVHITTYKTGATPTSGANPFDEFFKEFFGEEYERSHPAPSTPKGGSAERPAGTGSGVILTPDGYIATNNHVIDGASRIEVTLNDKRSYTATLVGTDPSTDLALLKIEAESLPFVRYGNSDEIKVGEWVLAVGNPFNLTSTVTAGIVSAKGRNINIIEDRNNLQIEAFIQTDAAVNPGNSGGALVNLQGELVGINSAIATPTGSFAGYSFAVPVTLVKKVMDDLLLYGQVQRALLGVSIQEVTAEVAKEKSLKKIEGVLILEAREGSAAGEAGLRKDDVILRVDDQPVNTASELQEAVARHRPGDKVTITFKRDGATKEAQVTLKNTLGTTELVKSTSEAIEKELGAKLEPISSADAKRLGIPGGVRVSSIGSGPLKSKGVKEGFIITHVDKIPVAEPRDVARILNQKKGSGVLLEGVQPSGSKDYYAIGW